MLWSFLVRSFASVCFADPLPFLVTLAQIACCRGLGASAAHDGGCNHQRAVDSARHMPNQEQGQLLGLDLHCGSYSLLFALLPLPLALRFAASIRHASASPAPCDTTPRRLLLKSHRSRSIASSRPSHGIALASSSIVGRAGAVSRDVRD